jgi:hypothetical protein
MDFRPTSYVMAQGFHNGEDFLRKVKPTMAKHDPKLRVHLGLDLDTVNGEEVENIYEILLKWLILYRELNKSGIWDSAFAHRLNISMTKKQ